MEKKNILLVIGSVTLFLIVVLAAGLWLFWPEPKPQSASSSASVRPVGSEGFDSFEYYRGRQDLPGLEEPKAGQPKDGPMTLSIGETKPQSPAVSVETRPAAPTRQLAPAAPAAVAKPVAAAPVRPTTPKLTRVSEFWIQAGSYKSRVGAEGLNRKLGELGLPGTITTRDIAGETYFRVRIGPYRNASDADKFLSTVKGVEGLRDSYVSRVTRTLTN